MGPCNNAYSLTMWGLFFCRATLLVCVVACVPIFPQAEQRKAEKKIQETEKRAGDIRKMKVRNVENARRKEATKTYGSREQQKNQQMLAMERAKEREKKRQQRLKTTKSKQVVVASQKEDKLVSFRPPARPRYALLARKVPFTTPGADTF